MPTTMPAIENAFNWDFLSALVGALVGGCFSLLGTWLTLRHQVRTIRLQEMTRLRWTKRWDVMATTYALLAKTELAFRKIVHQLESEEAEQGIKDAWNTWKEFDNYWFATRLFLPEKLEQLVEEVDDQFLLMHGAFSRFRNSLQEDHAQANIQRNHYRTEAWDCGDSLLGGELKKKMDQLKAGFREILDQDKMT